MGHYCRICKRERPNEQFSGHGHTIHVCRQCARKPKEGKELTSLEDELFGYMSQSNISKKNIARLKELSQGASQEVADLARIILEVAAIRPHKKGRLAFLVQNHPDLLGKLEKSGLTTKEDFGVFIYAVIGYSKKNILISPNQGEKDVTENQA